jgi:hypothetical protein
VVKSDVSGVDMPLDLSKDHHYSWNVPDDAEQAMKAGIITLNEYMEGLFYHPDPYLYRDAVTKYEENSEPTC